MSDDNAKNIEWANPRIKKYQNWHDAQQKENPETVYPKIRTMLTELGLTQGYMITYQDSKVSYGRPSLINQRHEIFIHDIKQNFEDHWLIHLKQKTAT